MYYWMKNRPNAVKRTAMLDDDIYEKIKQIQMETIERTHKSISFAEIIYKILTKSLKN